MLDYFYGEQPEVFVFYKMPKMLLTEEEYSGLSFGAMLLYGILLDLTSLSMKKGWRDELGRVYVIFTLENIMETLKVSDKTATKFLTGLEEVGLIERKHQGQGKPAVIYVKNFMGAKDLRFQTRKSYDSGLVKSTIPDSEELRCNNTYNNKTYNNDNHLLQDGGKKREYYTAYFEKSLEIWALKNDYPYETGIIDEIMGILVDTMCSDVKTIRIGGEDKSLETVKSVFMKLKYDHIAHVIYLLDNNDAEIHNMKGYMLTLLYSAVFTIDSYYKAKVSRDLRNPKE